MNTQQLDLFIMSNAKFFPQERLPYIKERLANLEETKAMAIMTMSFKDPTVSIIISVLVGGFGIDRFYIGNTGLGIAKLLTCGGLGIWTIVDWFLIMNATKEANFEMLMPFLA